MFQPRISFPSRKRVYKINDLFKGRARRKDLFDSHFLETADVLLRNDSPAKDRDIPRLVFLEESEHLAEQSHMGGGMHGKTDSIHIFLKCGAGDLFRSVVDAEIDHLHASIPQPPSDDLNSAVVTVETDFGNQNTEFPNWPLSIIRLA
jgi:hypothetical protein